jgi:hypothetical protein
MGCAVARVVLKRVLLYTRPSARWLSRARPVNLAYHEELGRLEESDDVAIRVPHRGNESALADVLWILDGLSAGIQE